MNSIDRIVELEDLQLQRGGRPLFHMPVSARFAPGVLSIVAGPNGSGKSSLLDIIALRSAPPNAAMIRCAHQIQSTDVAYLPQQLWDVFDIRISDLVALAMGRDCRAPVNAPEPLLDALANQKKDLGALSDGQRQLLLFWLVFSQAKYFFVYDEPLQHLDNVAAEYVFNGIEQQVRQGMLVVISEHSSETRWDIACQRIRLALCAAAA